jgi:hypothetical protein
MRGAAVARSASPFPIIQKLFRPLVGWGTLVFVHWWFYVRNASKLCMLKEEKIESKVATRMIKPE